MVNTFKAGAETQRRWKDRRGGLMVAMLALTGLNLLRASGDGTPMLVMIVALAAAVAVAALVVRIVDQRRVAALPEGTLHAITASLLIDELWADDRFREALVGVRRRSARWWALGRVSGRLEITPERLTWTPGRLSRRWRMPALELPLAAVQSAEIVSGVLPINYAGVDLQLVDGRRLAIETRGADRLRAAFARSALGDERRIVDPQAGPRWHHDPAPRTRPRTRPHLAPAARFGLLGGWVVLLALLFGPFNSGADTGNAVQDLAVAVFFLVGIAAVVLLLARQHSGTWASAVAGGSGLVASLGDLSFDPSLAVMEMMAFAAFVALALRLGRLPLAQPERARP